MRFLRISKILRKSWLDPHYQDALIWTGQLVLYLNSAVNPIIYGLCNSKYRQALLSCFHRVTSGKVRDPQLSNVQNRTEQIEETIKIQ